MAVGSSKSSSAFVALFILVFVVFGNINVITSFFDIHFTISSKFDASGMP